VKTVMRRAWLVAIPAAVLLLTGEGSAAPRWVILGTRQVSDRLDHDAITLGGSARYDALKVRVRDRAVQFRDLKVHYANGTVEDVSLRERIRAGGESRVIDLRGEARDIRRIEFWYDAETRGRGRGRGRGARVEVWGRRY
jgi:hypothetical protein